MNFSKPKEVAVYLDDYKEGVFEEQISLVKEAWYWLIDSLCGVILAAWKRVPLIMLGCLV